MKKKKRTLLAAAASAVTLAFGVCLLTWCPREPTYQGRDLSDWVIQFGPGEGFMAQRKEAEVALGRIGTNALPYLLRWLRYEPPQWRTTVKRYVPTPVAQFLLEHFYYRPGRRSNGANFCFALLPLFRTNAWVIIPELEVMAKDRGHPNTACNALEVLFSMGEQSLPVFQAVLVDQTQSNRVRVAEMVRFLGHEPRRSKSCAFILGKVRNDPDPNVSAVAAQWLENMKLAEMTK